MRMTEQASATLKSTVGIKSSEASASAQEMTGEAKGKASEVAGEAKGKASDVAGEAKGKASELSGKAQGTASELSGKAKGTKEEVKGKLWDRNMDGEGDGGVYACMFFRAKSVDLVWQRGGVCITEQLVSRERGRVIEKCCISWCVVIIFAGPAIYSWNSVCTSSSYASSPTSNSHTCVVISFSISLSSLWEPGAFYYNTATAGRLAAWE